MKKLFYALSIVFMALGCSEQPGGRLPSYTGPADLQLSHPFYPFDSDGGEFTLKVTSKQPWQAEVEEDGADWVSFDPAGPAGESNITVIVTPNGLDDKREVDIIFTSGSESKTLSIRQDGSSLALSTSELMFSHIGGTLYVNVTTDFVGWSVSVDPAAAEWCSAVTEGDDIVAITTTPNSGDGRTATVHVTTGEQTQDVTVTQNEFSANFRDKEVVNLQRARVGKGINLLLMGDGYTAADMATDGGRYITDIRTAADHFFSVWPYNEFRDYFNIWMIAAVSAEEGVSVTSPKKVVNTVFQCEWRGEGYTDIRLPNYDDTTVKQYASLLSAHTGIHPNRLLRELTVIIPINEDIYAGTCMIYIEDDYDNLSGFSIAMVPRGSTGVGRKFQNLIVHEAGGHGFGKLFDEYYQYNFPNASIIGTTYENELRTYKNVGYVVNVDMHSTMAETTWAEFADYPAYDMVGMFEGAYLHGHDVWRPEFDSCMNNNALYFNAPSRWAIVRRIMSWSGVDDDYTVAEFVEMERGRIPAYPTGTRTAPGEPFIPLGRPVLMGNR